VVDERTSRVRRWWASRRRGWRGRIRRWVGGCCPASSQKSVIFFHLQVHYIPRNTQHVHVNRIKPSYGTLDTKKKKKSLI
jgi:hypothetical protein